MRETKNDNRDAPGIDYEFMPWNRKWLGGLGFHPYKNQVGGASNVTRKQCHNNQQALARKMKQLKNKNKNKNNGN